MNWSSTTVIVSFRDRMRNIDAAEYLKDAEGFLRVKHVYTFTNSALIEVLPGRLDIFISDMKNYDDVEFCEYNYHVLPQAINEFVGPWLQSAGWSCREARDIHGLTKEHASGTNVCVAIIDSGISPHPYLPAISFSQALSFIEQWPDFIKGHIPAEKEIRNIVHLELSKPWPLSSDATQTEQHRFLGRAESYLLEFYRKCREAWVPHGIRWHQNTIPLYRAFRNQQSNSSFVGGPTLPQFPTHNHAACGPLRRISLYSRNFIDNSLDVEDTHGHGTHMSGLLAGRVGASLAETNANKKTILEKYEVDTLGVVPNAELMILKCYDDDDITESNVDALIRALEHACESGADVIYCGLAFDPGPRGIPTKTAITLDRTVQVLAQQEIPVVCPAGNHGKDELEFPAACSGAFAITAIAKDTNNQLTLSSYSNYAGPFESVRFTAFGGEKEMGIITTGLNFGFSRVSGTSVAAAITAGIIARFVSGRNTEHRDKKYRDAMYDTLHSGVEPSSAVYLGDLPRIPLSEIISEAKVKTYQSLSSVNAPHKQAFGHGLIRQFL